MWPTEVAHHFAAATPLGRSVRWRFAKCAARTADADGCGLLTIVYTFAPDISPLGLMDRHTGDVQLGHGTSTAKTVRPTKTTMSGSV